MAREVAKTLDQVEQGFLKTTNEDVPVAEATDKRTDPKELLFERDEYGLYVVRYTAGGELPDTLKGRYTSLPMVTQAIENYKTTQRS